MQKRIVFDRNVVNNDVAQLKHMGYTDDLIEIYIKDGQARARLIGQRLSMIDKIKLLFAKRETR